MNYNFRKASLTELPQIWEILQQAILRRKRDGSQQWQDGYPNPDVIKSDIVKGAGYVLTDGDRITGYAAILFNDEPAYENINGKWLTNGDFVVVHRIAISEQDLGKSLAQKMLSFTEDVALKNDTFSIKADTNFDNIAMLRTFEKSGYTYCGEVLLRGGVRKAFEKNLVKSNKK